jgi:hypothetical protein
MANAFPAPAQLDAELKDMRTTMQLFKMNLGLHNPVEYNVEENSLLRDFHAQMRSGHTRLGFLLAEAKDTATKEKLDKVAEEIESHFKLFEEAKGKYSKKARNIKMVKPVKGGAVVKKGAIKITLPNKDKAIQAMRVLREASQKTDAAPDAPPQASKVADQLTPEQIEELKELLGEDWMDLVEGLLELDEETIASMEAMAAEGFEDDEDDDLTSKLLSKAAIGEEAPAE